MGKGLRPAAVLACAGVAMAVFLLTRSAAVGQAFNVSAYLIGLLSCWRGAMLYPRESPIRLGWVAMGGNCLFSIFRHAVLIRKQFVSSTDALDIVSQSLQLPALICVLLGLGAMWWGVYRLGLGFRVRWWECGAIAAAAALIAWIFRGDLSHAHAAEGVLTALQLVNLSLLIAISGVGLLLHSLAMQMGGGRLAVVMRSVAAYALIRALLNLSQVEHGSSPLWLIFFYGVPWLFAFGAACACWLADGVSRSIQRDPISHFQEIS